MATATYIVSQGQNALAFGKATVIGIPKTVTALTFAAWLAANATGLEPFSMAYNGIYMLDPTHADALVAYLDYDGKWYGPTNAEVVLEGLL